MLDPAGLSVTSWQRCTQFPRYHGQQIPLDAPARPTMWKHAQHQSAPARGNARAVSARCVFGAQVLSRSLAHRASMVATPRRHATLRLRKMFPEFDRSRLIVKPLAERVHDIQHSSFLSLDHQPPALAPQHAESIRVLGRRLVAAREKGAARLILMGAHVIRAGVGRQLIDMMERGLVTHIGMNGAGPIHDYEMAKIGATCESVARYIRSGEFGLWHETGEMNDIVARGASEGLGVGESLGRAIEEGNFAHKDTSVLAAGYRLRIPITVHVGFGYDILHEHPNFDPAAWGEATYRDFLILCATVDRLEGGVFLCLGSAVMGPEVYLKALSMCRNVAHQEGRRICHFTTAAFDLIEISGDAATEAPKSNPQYYYRPWKTILVRTVADGGESFYIAGDHRVTAPTLRLAALAAEQGYNP